MYTVPSRRVTCVVCTWKKSRWKSHIHLCEWVLDYVIVYSTLMALNVKSDAFFGLPLGFSWKTKKDLKRKFKTCSTRVRVPARGPVIRKARHVTKGKNGNKKKIQKRKFWILKQIFTELIKLRKHFSVLIFLDFFFFLYFCILYLFYFF